MRISSTKYLVGSQEDTVKPKHIKPPFTYASLKEKGIEKVYNQSEFDDLSRMACSIYACLTAISNNYNIEYSSAEREKIIMDAIYSTIGGSRGGFSMAKGWWMDLAALHVAKWTRQHKGLEIHAVHIHWMELDKMAALGWMPVTGFKGREGWRKDRIDGVVGNEGMVYGKVIYAHLEASCRSLRWHKLLNLFKQLTLVDSYGKNYKYKEVKIENYAELRKQDTVFPSAFVFMPGKGH